MKVSVLWENNWKICTGKRTVNVTILCLFYSNLETVPTYFGKNSGFGHLKWDLI